MIDLHSHLLPGIDDGAQSLDVSIEMAKLAVADGVKIMACTPHYLPPKYNNTGKDIMAAVATLQAELDKQGIPLRLLAGADVHLLPALLGDLKSGTAQTLRGTRYFLLEPDHHIAPPNFLKFTAGLMAAGYKPILTHPERLTWIEHKYDLICAVEESGVAIQVTGAAITGKFGEMPLKWAERLLREGRVDILASDAHNVKRRPPGLSLAVEAAANIIGQEAALRLVIDNPTAILRDEDLPPKTRISLPPKEKTTFMQRIGIGRTA